MKSSWLLCPVCEGKTRVKLLPETEIKNFPLFCPKCKNESIVTIKGKDIQKAG